MTEWEIHEAVLEDIAKHGAVHPVQIDIPEGYMGKVPPGRYRQDENEMWCRIGPPDEKVTMEFKPDE